MPLVFKKFGLGAVSNQPGTQPSTLVGTYLRLAENALIFIPALGKQMVWQKGSIVVVQANSGSSVSMVGSLMHQAVAFTYLTGFKVTLAKGTSLTNLSFFVA